MLNPAEPGDRAARQGYSLARAFGIIRITSLTQTGTTYPGVKLQIAQRDRNAFGDGKNAVQRGKGYVA